MGRSGSLQLARVFGIRIGADYGWLLILFLAIFFAYGQLDELTTASGTGLYLAAVGAAFLFFASIIAHELGHALAARREQIEVSGIDLFLFGGLMHMRSEPETPGAEFRVAAAGPAATVLVILVASAAGIAIGGTDEFLDAALLRSSGTIGVGTLMVSSIASINVLVLVFNLIPAYPLDGGRIARAAVWRATGDRNRATRAAALVGRGFGLLLVACGVALIVAGDAFDGVYLAVLGWLLSSQARGVMVQTEVRERLHRITVGELMDTDPVTIGAHVTGGRAYEDFFLRYQGYEWFLVVDTEGRYVGVVNFVQVRKAAEGPGAELPVGEFAEPVEPVLPEAALDELLQLEPLQRFGALFAVDADGILRGVMTAEQAARALRAATPGAATAP